MSSGHNRIVLVVAGAGPLLFFAIATLEGFLRAGYDPIAQPISALALGDRGWIQTFNFGLLALSFVAMAAIARTELRSRAASFGFLIMAIGVAIAGTFPMDAPGALPTRAGNLHMLGGFLVFPLMPIVLLRVGLQLRRDARWRSYSVYTLVTGLLCLATIAFFLTFVGPPGFARPFPDLAGLVQRLQLLPFFVWMAFVVHHARRDPTAALDLAIAK